MYCADQQRGSGIHDRRVQAPASAGLLRGGKVVMENHRATVGEHDSSVRGHGAHALPGGGKPWDTVWDLLLLLGGVWSFFVVFFFQLEI